jgi:hypothetical protein
MEFNEKLFNDPVVRAMLWCLICDGELEAEAMQACGFTADEAGSILRDEEGRLRQLRLRLGIARRFNVEKLAALLRSRLAEHVEALQKSTELAGMLRSMKSLPTWLFPEWQAAVPQQEYSVANLLKLNRTLDKLERTAN